MEFFFVGFIYSTYVKSIVKYFFFSKSYRSYFNFCLTNHSCLIILSLTLIVRSLNENYTKFVLTKHQNLFKMSNENQNLRGPRVGK